jgi:antitoxin (DNA-binding transcriptional repressor) of toxin-antitoxin stability system
VKRLSVRQLREAITHLDDMVAKEGEILITRRGKTIARVLPIRGARPLPSHADLRSRMKRLKVSSESLVREERDSRG